MKTSVFMLAAAIALGAPAAASAATVPVQQLNGPFTATNSTVTKTADGVHFGTYTDGGAIGGTLDYSGLNGQKLSALRSFGMTYTYREQGATSGAAPYMRVFLDENPAVDSPTTGNVDFDNFLHYNDGVPNNDIDHDVVLDPGECGTDVPPQSTDVTSNTANTTVRFDDDACGTNPQEPYSAILADPARAGMTIVDVLVSQGNSTGVDVSGLLRRMTLNDTTFAFDVAPAGTTTVVQVPGPATPTPSAGVLGLQVSSCKGNDLVTLHAPKRKGQRFVSARATLRGKRLTVHGRSIRVDLRHRTEGAYDVRIATRYRTRSGRVVTSVTHRVRSIACG